MSGFLSTFSQPFRLAVLLWPLASGVLTVPVAAYLYHRDGRLRPVPATNAYLFILYMLGLGCFTLYPWPDDAVAYCAAHHLTAQLDPLRFVGDIRADGVTAVLQIVMNVVLFVPLGFFLRRFFRMPSWASVVLCVGVSALIEITQLTGVFHLYPCAYRVCDVDDVLSNAFGGVCGVLVARWWDRAFPQRRVGAEKVNDHPGFVRRCVAAAIDVALIVVCWTLTALPWPGMGHGGLVWLLVAWFAVFECLVPWRSGGSTLGGMFVRMSVETRPRAGVARVAFYAARATVLYVALFGLVTWGGAWPVLLWVVLAVFWAARRCMPYDLIG